MKTTTEQIEVINEQNIFDSFIAIVWIARQPSLHQNLAATVF